MRFMFYNCSSITTLDVSGFDTSSVDDVGLMFYNCSSLEELDVSRFDTSGVEDMSYMFYGCSSLTNFNVSGFDVADVTDMANMFNGSSLSDAEYDELLVAWSAQSLQSEVTAHFGSAKYTESAARTILTDTYLWDITDGGAACDALGRAIAHQEALSNRRGVRVFWGLHTLRMVSA